jgi:uncharacterized protein
MDRLSIRQRPDATPVLHQSWGSLLFLHWPVPAELLRPLIPERLQIDTHEGTAWVGMTPFTLWGTRPPLLPAVPYLSDSHELNVRTYVHLDGIPGVWFLSLDASNVLAVIGARLGYHLPYFQAKMSLTEEADTVHFTSTRRHPAAPDAALDVTWRRKAERPEAQPGSLDFFLIERYALYTEKGDTLYRARIHHRPWPLREAELLSLSSTMLESHGLPAPSEQPLLHAQAEPLDVEIFLLEKV